MNGDENEFEFEGKTYVAVVDELGIYGCGNCAFKDKDCAALPSCFAEERGDSLPAHFEEKQ
jgi:hypothetical protein